MQAFKETTVWDSGTALNHTYLLEGDKMLAYIRHGTRKPFWFKNPITIDRRGRKFEAADAGLFEREIFTTQVKPVATKEVQGSKGQTYIVNLEEKTCTCPGYTYRGACKHISELV